jgi:hypothetical protein
MSKTKSYYLSNPSEETQRLMAEWQKLEDEKSEEWWEAMDKDDEFIERETEKGGRYEWQ